MLSIPLLFKTPLVLLITIGLVLACNAKRARQKADDGKDSGTVSLQRKPVLDVGTRLLYLVKLSDKVRFNLEAEVTMISPEFRFSFYMNNMDFTFGAVHVSREAMDNSLGLRLLFDDGLTELKDATALRISDKAYENIVTQRKTLLSVQESETEWFFFVENEEVSVELDGEHFLASSILLRNDKETKELKICRNVSHPVVLYAKFKDGISVELLQWHNPPSSRGKAEDAFSP